MLTGTDVDLAPGQVLGLRGASGSGKSTLAAVLAGIRRPDHGRVEIDGQPLAAVSGPRPVQLVLQRPELAMNPRWHIRDVLAEAAPDGLDTAIEATGLVDPGWLDRYPHEISGGELQRVNLARALLARPRYLLLDEISASLDSLTQARLWRHILDQVPSERLGVLAISHDPVLLARVADAVVDLPQLQVRSPHGGDGDDLAGPAPRRSEAR